MLYYRISKGLNTKGELHPITTNLYSLIDKSRDNYKSAFLYDENHYKQFQTMGSVAGIQDVVSNILYWDFDNGSNIELAKLDAISLVGRLREKRIDNIQIYFSGKKGFEVRIEVKDYFTPKQIKKLCLSLGENLPTLDTQIYNANRLMRIPLTRHQETGLFKMPLTIDELSTLSIEQIKEEARDVSGISEEVLSSAFGKTTLPNDVLEALNMPEKEIANTTIDPKTHNLENVDWTKKPAYLPASKWLLEQGFFDEGERSTAAMILAATYKSLGYDENKAYYNLKAAMQLQAERTGAEKFPKKELWNNIIKQVYSNLWLGGTYSESDTPLLTRLAKSVPGEITSTKKDVLTIDQVGERFKSFIKDIDKNLLQFGIPDIDNHLDAMIGRVYIIGGSPGSGKTSLALQILNNTSKKNIHSMFFTFDMSVEDNNQKLIQKHHRLTPKQVFEYCKDLNKYKEYQNTLKSEYGNVFFIDSSGMSKEIMEDRILTTEKNLGIDIKLIVVDYLDLVQADFSDSTQKSMAIIQGLKEIASKHRKCVLVLSQPNKANQKINEPITSYAGIKGSSAVAELANAVLWVYRPGAQSGSYDNDRYYSIDCLKNRHGAMFSVDLAWNGVIGEVRPLTATEKVNLANYRQELKEKKKEEKEDWRNF